MRINYKIILTSLTLALLILAMPALKAQHPAVKDFYNHYKNEKDVQQLEIDGAVFKLMAWVTSWDDQDPDARAMNRLAENIKGLNIVVVPKRLEGRYSFKDVQRHVKNDRFDELMNVREEGSLISFYAQGEEKALRDMIIFIDDADNYSIISVRGVLNMDDLQYLASNHAGIN